MNIRKYFSASTYCLSMEMFTIKSAGDSKSIHNQRLKSSSLFEHEIWVAFAKKRRTIQSAILFRKLGTLKRFVVFILREFLEHSTLHAKICTVFLSHSICGSHISMVPQ